MKFFAPIVRQGEKLRLRHGLAPQSTPHPYLDIVFGPFGSEQGVKDAVRNIFSDYPPEEIWLMEGRMVKVADLAEDSPSPKPPAIAGPEQEFDGLGSA